MKKRPPKPAQSAQQAVRKAVGEDPARKKRSNKSLYAILLILLIVLVWLLIRSCPAPRGENRTDAAVSPAVEEEGRVQSTFDLNLDFSRYKVTFIEIGAERCIPCREMQPIMRDIAAEYAGTVRVVFYDVWKDPSAARYYGVQLIPTQVFIDSAGREIHRHVGLFPKEEILAMLRQKGMLP